MDNILTLSKRVALIKIGALSNELFARDGISVDFNDSMSTYVAGTYSDDNGYASSVEIGLYDIKNSKSNGLFKPHFVSDTDFARVLLNMYHERCHCTQKNKIFRSNNMDELSERQLVQEVACRENPDYYKNDGNYSINANEIQAEHYGISHAYDYLCKEFPMVDVKYHEDVMVNIVNEKMQNSTYFVHSSKPFVSLQEVDDAFNEAYKSSFTKNRTYYVENMRTTDCVKKYMQMHKDAKTVYLNSKDAFEKDKCVAAVNLELHPNWKSAYPCLQNMGVSYATVIEKPYQVMANKKTPEQIREEQINQMLHGNRQVVQSRTQSSSVKKSLSREEALNRLARKIDYSDSQSDYDCNHDSFS